MSLFNILSIHQPFNYSSKTTNARYSFFCVKKYKVKKSTTKTLTIFVQPPSELFLVSKLKSIIQNKQNNNNLADKDLLSPTFLDHFVNKYWEETIFFSKSNAISDKYYNQLKSYGLSIYKHPYKKFLFEFSRALITGSMKTHLSQVQNISNVASEPTDVQYTWRKGLNCYLSGNLSTIIFNKSKNSFGNRVQLEVIKKTKHHKLPIFAVANGFRQIVVAEPADELVINKNPIDHIHQWYSDNILAYKDKRPAYESLFFINVEDALEYKAYIANKYLNYGTYDNQNHLSVLSSSLDFYYNLIDESHPRVCFRLIPDLKELGQLINEYQYYGNILFHKKQKYGKDYFQGQPIYIIEPIYSKNKENRQNHLISYSYISKDNIDLRTYKSIFMNYDVALLAWKKFISHNTNYSLPSTPQILVYNLEDFLAMHDYDLDLHKISPIFIPSQDSYKFIQLSEKAEKPNTIVRTLLNQSYYFKIFAKRLIWSLTSRQPINL